MHYGVWGGVTRRTAFSAAVLVFLWLHLECRFREGRSIVALALIGASAFVRLFVECRLIGFVESRLVEFFGSAGG